MPFSSGMGQASGYVRHRGVLDFRRGGTRAFRARLTNRLGNSRSWLVLLLAHQVMGVSNPDKGFWSSHPVLLGSRCFEWRYG